MSAAAAATDARPLRVLFLATYFPKPGNEQMGPWALSQAQALRRAGADVRVASMTSWLPRALAGRRRRSWAECPETHSWDGLRVDYPRWPFYSAGLLKRLDYAAPATQHRLGWLGGAAAALRRIVRTHRPDVVFAHHSWISGDLARRLRAEFDVPYVVTDHDYEEITDCERLPARRRYFDAVLRNAACFVAVSRRMEADVRRLFPDTPATTTIHNGSDPIDPALLNAPRPPELVGKQALFCAAHFYPRKGVPLLVRAFARVAARHPNAVLRIAGDGEDRPNVEDAARTLPPLAASHAANSLGHSTPRITLLGAQPHPRVLQEIAWSDAFALVGWNEPWGVVYNEAMSAGRPIICSDDGGITDVVRDGVHGLVVPPRDVDAAAAALDRMLSDDAARARMGAAARALYESQLTWDANAAALLRVLRDAASAAGAGRP